MKKKIFFFGILAAKLFLLTFFSSDFRDTLFVPFIKTFLSEGGNPWEFVLHNNLPYEFPYPPLMLYLISIPYAIYLQWFTHFPFLEGFFFQLPTIIADLTILSLLFRLVPLRKKECLLYYFGSPIILYAIYAHSQLDLIPTAFLVASTFCIAFQYYLPASLLLGLALSTKFHILAALPFFWIYALKQRRYGQTALLVILPFTIYLGFSAPFLLSEAYQNLVLFNPKQMQLYEVFYTIGEYRVYLPLFAATLLYLRFLALKAINQDLFYIFLTMLFATFILFVCPSPAWYVWLVPFFALFSSKLSTRKKEIFWLYATLCTVYLIFFLFFYRSPINDLTFLGQPLHFKVENAHLANIVYTVLESILLINLYVLYRFGLQTNRVYLRQEPLFIGIAGDSAAGKTSLMYDLKSILENRVTILEGDGDHKWERNDKEWEQYTHLDPKANELHRQADHLITLKMGEAIWRSEYDHKTGTFTQPKKVAPKPYVIFCGLHPFYLPKARKAIDVKIYLDPEEELRKKWKIQRDTSERGHALQKVQEVINRRTNDAARFIHPQKEFADLVISYHGDLSLTCTLDANLNIEGMIKIFHRHQLQVDWDFEDNLEKQYFTLHSAPSKNSS